MHFLQNCFINIKDRAKKTNKTTTKFKVFKSDLNFLQDQRFFENLKNFFKNKTAKLPYRLDLEVCNKNTFLIRNLLSQIQQDIDKVEKC